VAVIASVPGAGEEPVTGELLTIDNLVDQTTGTIKAKATFPNDDHRLWPGAFATVRVQVDTLAGVTTVPLVAVQRGPDGAYAFVIRPPAEEGAPPTVQQRPLTLGPVTQTLAVVREGLRPGERVVTSGALRLSDGARVMVAEGGAGATAAGAAPGRPPAGSGQGPRRRQRPAESEAAPAPPGPPGAAALPGPPGAAAPPGPPGP
jgi:multidrug efflux system membrane fusion protein